MDTGSAQTDAEYDFLRIRRRQVLSRLAAWLRREPDDVSEILPFDEVVAALGRTGERPLGLQVIPLDSVVGSVDRTRDFDRYFRPRSQRTRKRWERLAVAQRRGETIPPIDVYRVGGLHFVRDGHHRVSVAHALGLRTIEAKVTEVTTRIDPNGIVHRGDLITKDLRRVLLDRVPLSGRALESITVTDPWSYAELSKTVEAWGFRLMQHEGRFLDRETVARRWWSEEFTPVVRMLRQAELIGDRTDAEAYLQLACQRYRLLRTHRWDDEVVDHLRNDPGP
ncbi:chromosome partitioning protein ParB [Pseudonocardia bannensis]